MAFVNAVALLRSDNWRTCPVVIADPTMCPLSDGRETDYRRTPDCRLGVFSDPSAALASAVDRSDRASLSAHRLQAKETHMNRRKFERLISLAAGIYIYIYKPPPPTTRTTTGMLADAYCDLINNLPVGVKLLFRVVISIGRFRIFRPPYTCYTFCISCNSMHALTVIETHVAAA